jgi:hypothetical protein
MRSVLRIFTITTLVALTGLLGCASLPDKLYRQIGDSEIGKINRIGLMQKYGPPRRIDKMDGHEFWTYVLDLGVQSNTFGTSYSSGSAAGFSPAPGTAQAFGYTSGFGSSSSFSQPVRDEFTYEIDKSGIVVAYRFWSRRPYGSTAYSSRTGYVNVKPKRDLNEHPEI